MPVMSLKLDRRYNGQQCISEYNYVASGVPASVTLSFALASAFGVIDTAGVYPLDTPFGTLRAFQTTDVRYVEAIVKDLYSNIDFFTTPFLANTFGQASNASGGLPNYQAVAMRTNRIRSDIRRGQKRYEGLAEAHVSSFGVIEAATMTAIESHAAELSQTLTYDDEGNTITFVPCVISLKKNLTDPDQGPYIKWPTVEEQMSHLASGVVWEALSQTTTQNSRKAGRGS